MRAFALIFCLLSTPALAGKPVCGDGRLHNNEACDGTDLRGETCSSQGFDAGTLTCSSSCTLDTTGCTTIAAATCGDNVTEGYEECDGTDDSTCPGECSDHCACPSTSPGDLEIHMIDVGQGDSILVVSPDGFTMLVDAGTDGQSSTVSSYLSTLGITDVDYTLVSHMHADHLGGMDGVLTSFPDTVACFDNGEDPGTNEYGEYITAAGDRQTILSRGEFIDLGPSMTAEVLHASVGSSSENDNSLVVKLTYGDNTVLLGGDCEEACESSFDPGLVQVYKVHHHGSSTSSTTDFLDLMAPYTALVSVGASNAYGHPTQPTLDALGDIGASVYRTDLDGDLEVLLNGASYTVNGEPVCATGESLTCGETDVGACTLGTRACTGGMWDTCSAILPEPEDCANGIDDDCDGATDAADADCTSGASDILIVQVAYDTPGTDSIEEFVDLYNPTDAAVSLDGWSLTDGASSWSLPASTTIDAGSYLSIARDATGFAALHGFSPDIDGMTLSLNNTGDVLILSDETDTEVDRVAWEGFETGWSITASSGDAIERTVHDTDTDTVSDWSVISPAAPLGGIAAADADGDGYDTTVDCDDTDSAINPGATEICGDGIDDDCSGTADDGLDDVDLDGYVDALCTGSAGTDCDDLDETINPGAAEVCEDGIDQDCSGADLTCSTCAVSITEALYWSKQSRLRVRASCDDASAVLTVYADGVSLGVMSDGLLESSSVSSLPATVQVDADCGGSDSTTSVSRRN